MKRLLIIEDQEAFRQFVTLALQMEGYDVQAAETGEAGLQLLNTTTPDLIMLDVEMASVSGWDVLRFIRGHPDLKLLPVVVLTGHAGDEIRQRSILEGANTLLVKPVSLDEILQTLNDLLP